MTWIKETLKRTNLYDMALSLRTLSECLYIKSAGKSPFAYSIAKCRWNLSPKEFIYYHWDELNASDRKKYVLLKEYKDFIKKVNSIEAHDLLCDKYLSYLRFKEYYQRDCFLQQPDTSNIHGVAMGEDATGVCSVCGGVLVDDGDVHGRQIADFQSFVSRNNKVIIKPLGSRGGKGIKIYSTDNIPSMNQLMIDYPKGFIAETLIVQSEEMGRFHPESVNTLRINTIRYDDSVEVMWPCLRFGVGKSIVDNTHAGGVFSAIDVESGIIIATVDEMGNTYENHPNSGLPFSGFKVPRWDKACRLAKELATRLPENRFTGWDLALTDNGWVVVEGNYCPQIIWQIAARRGIRDEYEKMKEKLKINGR